MAVYRMAGYTVAGYTIAVYTIAVYTVAGFTVQALPRQPGCGYVLKGDALGLEQHGPGTGAVHACRGGHHRMEFHCTSPIETTGVVGLNQVATFHPAADDIVADDGRAPFDHIRTDLACAGLGRAYSADQGAVGNHLGWEQRSSGAGDGDDHVGTFHG